MPELRQNIILKEWVVISTERAKRPEQLKEDSSKINVDEPVYEKTCPFCAGNEEKFGNTEEFLRYGTEKEWKLRVIPNKYPALVPKHGDVSINTEGMHRCMDGVGQHEVLIETPRHNVSIATMTVDEVELTLKAYRERYTALMSMPYIESVILFRNHGTRAGASLRHPHSQIIALPIIPRDIQYRINESIRYYQEHRASIFARVLEDEIKEKKRIILETEHFVVFVPFAAGTPFHMWIFPRQHRADFSQIEDIELQDLARTLRTTLAKLYYGLNNPDYNYIIRSAPRGYEFAPYFRWYVTIIPRLTRTAGFELGSGMFINTSIPEEDAEYLRGIKVPKV